jgi:glycosyltransferase involved in cell wall biosynthesis
VRVLHVQKANGIAGSERHLLALLPALNARGIETRMCVLETGEGHRFVAALRHAGVDVSAHAAGPDVNPVLIGMLAAEIRHYRPDVVHTHLVHADASGQLAAALTRVPGVSSVHGAPAFYRREPYRSLGRAVGRLAARRIAISHSVARFVSELRLAPPERIRVIHYGIDAAEWTATESDRRRARASFEIADDEVVVGIAARLIAGKGHAVLIESFARATANLPRLRLLIVGDGPERRSLESLAEHRCPPDTVRFVGFTTDVASVFAASDLLVFPTLPELSEGFGLAPLEAMATGRPVVVSAVGALPEVVDDVGIVVPPASVETLRAAILNLAGDAALRHRLGSRSAARARDVFGLETMVSRTVGLYEEIA